MSIWTLIMLSRYPRCSGSGKSPTHEVSRLERTVPVPLPHNARPIRPPCQPPHRPSHVHTAPHHRRRAVHRRRGLHQRRFLVSSSLPLQCRHSPAACRRARAVGFFTATVVTLSCLCGAYRSRGRMKCSICHYEAREDGVSGHTARQCPLNNKECRHTLSEDNPFYKPGQCINPGCGHVRQCNVCHMVGHTAAALRLTTCRWRLTSDRRIVPKVNTPALTPSDSVCPLMTAASVAELLHFVHLLGQ
ncbi:hypothetical protein BU14_0014s0037 [Porphyra umbilicalis]|uniref:Uncharacterized protein n=1 Tax=Porphyra umbilicalis TaxID=2786 RepID=A0A1X6PL39_PORUM|nr:hypothetical protein BU14_0014s0037 [Porphyra umbilicalis]|eukprot:OSX81486.1 hypothetical protein BU14_0014s0037 [Porphyra umbilicalis]